MATQGEEKIEEHQFQYDLSRLQFIDNVLPTAIALMGLGFTLLIAVPLLPSTLGEVTRSIYLTALEFLGGGLFILFGGLIFSIYVNSRFQARYNLTSLYRSTKGKSSPNQGEEKEIKKEKPLPRVGRIIVISVLIYFLAIVSDYAVKTYNSASDFLSKSINGLISVFFISLLVALFYLASPEFGKAMNTMFGFEKEEEK